LVDLHDRFTRFFCDGDDVVHVSQGWLDHKIAFTITSTA